MVIKNKGKNTKLDEKKLWLILINRTKYQRNKIEKPIIFS